MWATLRPSTSSSRTIRLSWLSRMARMVSNIPESISRSTVPAEGSVRLYRSDSRVHAGRQIGRDVGHAEAIDFVIAYDQVVLAVADGQNGVEHPGIHLEIHGSSRGQREGIQIGEAQAGPATGVGERSRRISAN